MAKAWIFLCNCSDATQGELLRSFLENAGIRARLSSDRPGWTGRYSVMARGVRLEVSPEMLTEAQTLLEAAESGEFALSEEEAWEMADEVEAPDAPYRPVACPGCGSGNIHKQDLGGKLFRLLNLLLLGLPWLLRPTTWCCADCGWEWRRGEEAST